MAAQLGRWCLILGLIALLSTSKTTADAPGNDTSEEGATWGAPATAASGGGSDEALLKWALAHSDPDALRAAAAEARRGAEERLPDFLERQQRVQQLLDAMKQEPTEAELMQEAVSVLSNSSSTHHQLADALQALRYLVEPIDSANDLQGMGGLAPLIALLGQQQQPRLQAAAAHVLGTAAANNHVFQEQLLGEHPEALLLLLHLLAAGDEGSAHASGSTSTSSTAGDPAAALAASEAALEVAEAAAEASAKALYCLSAILRGSPAARTAFYHAAGVAHLQALLRSGGAALRLKRKALSLLTDLIHLDAAAMDAAAAAAAAAAGALPSQQQQQQQQQGGPAASGAAGLDFPAAVAAALQLLEVGAAAEAGPGPGQQQASAAGAGAATGTSAHDRDLQEKALLVLLALLDSGSSTGRRAAAGLIADAGGLATLRRLEASLRAEAAAGAVVAEGRGHGDDEEVGDDEGADYVQELLDLVAQVQRHVQQQELGTAASSGGGGSGAIGGGVSSGAGHDGAEL